MKCADIQPLVDPWIDDELPVEQRSQVEQHLAQCDECRQLFDERNSEHIQLRAAFAPDRQSAMQLAEQVLQELPHVSTAKPAGSGYSIWSLLLALAAGFLLALMVFPPWNRRPTERLVAGTPELSADLTLVSGPVQMSCDQAATWMTCPAPVSIDQSCRLMTGPESRCEVRTDEGTIVRLNTDTDVEIPRRDQVNLNKGQIWCRSDGLKNGLKITVEAQELTVQGTCDIRQQAHQTYVVVCDGTTTLQGSDWQATLQRGQWARVVDGNLNETNHVADPLLATRWVHGLLAKRAATDPETLQRIEDLWSAIGRAKLDHLYEDELRILGDRCTKPLIAYLNSSQSRDDVNKRIRAVRILADVAGHDAAPELVELLDNENAEIRFHAARGLERLTGRNFGLATGDWRDSSPGAKWQPAVKSWRQWINSDRDNIPSDPFVPPPTPPRKKKG